MFFAIRFSFLPFEYYLPSKFCWDFLLFWLLASSFISSVLSDLFDSLYPIILPLDIIWIGSSSFYFEAYSIFSITLIWSEDESRFIFTNASDTSFPASTLENIINIGYFYSSLFDSFEIWERRDLDCSCKSCRDFSSSPVILAYTLWLIDFRSADERLSSVALIS